MNLLIVTTKKDFSASRLEEEAIKKGFSVEKLLYEEITMLNKETFKKFNFCILRDPYNTGIDFSRHLVKIKSFFNKDSLLDFNTLNKFPEYEDKLFQNIFFSRHKIKMAEFHQITSLETLDSLKFPLILKKRISSRGKAVFLAKSKLQAKEFLTGKNIQDYITEDYIKVEKDYRILILAGKVIGGVIRKVNIHPGKISRIGVKILAKATIPEDVKTIALKIAKLIECNFTGVDIFQSKNELYFGECNISPQFAAFEKITKTNVAGALMDFIKKKTS